jgi:hypothetical protein
MSWWLKCCKSINTWKWQICDVLDQIERKVSMLGTIIGQLKALKKGKETIMRGHTITNHGFFKRFKLINSLFCTNEHVHFD